MKIVKILVIILIVTFLIACNEKKDFIELEITEIYHINSSDNNDLLIIRVPKNYKYHQKVLSSKFSVKPDDIYMDGEDKLARIYIDNGIDEVIVTHHIKIYRYDYIVANQFENIKEKRPENLDDFLVYSGSDELLVIAEDLTGKSNKMTINNILRFISENMIYEIHDEELSGYDAYLRGEGDCTEFSDLFATLCMLNDIPTRTIMGYYFSNCNTNIPFAHEWSEVYLDNYGWIPIDATPKGNYISRFPEKMDNRYIYLGYNGYSSPYNYAYSEGLDVYYDVEINKLN
ncbi:hypothetical protein EW093_02245 [Thiospirochaeta perfilievii]|uniref:Transglutaminase-like domain-containing protein n=1 Tax=Thiospirochaeta perfilievii TaxID=252967 RepID=A0A5C1Q9U4_9SPIO|nr:transglutaminase domain-containing protein [Thiospirochaeta perfilievii]QEN03566.1 hypothetical protein EW093_02245 [Thiospirochaeta perfilievii]